ncbi:unnamed protein product [Paramecium sonneborni]|uniref:Uncharacterized protein n=1 Tax=Paramecium sonneborni TaxID=65129 RepID=A0A8S1R4G3_9CILI|nr:unnamed protein product [Paramecium sonneborni]
MQQKRVQTSSFKQYKSFYQISKSKNVLKKIHKVSLMMVENLLFALLLLYERQQTQQNGSQLKEACDRTRGLILMSQFIV